MNAKTHIANAIDIAKDKSSYNEHAINILSDLHILAHIMQGTLHECKDMSIPDIISTIEGTPEVKVSLFIQEKLSLEIKMKM